MKPRFSKKTSTRAKARIKNKVRIRRKLNGTGEKPRLCVYRSALHTYVQLVDDASHKTIASTSSLKLKIKNGGNAEAAKAVGEAIAKAALEKNIEKIVFDRSGYIFHGRIKAVAEGAREAGLKF